MDNLVLNCPKRRSGHDRNETVSGRRILREKSAVFGAVERKNDMVLGNACRFQFPGDTVFGAIALNPHFVTNQINMQQVLLNPPKALPAHRSDNESPAFPVENDFVGDVFTGIAALPRKGSAHAL